MGRRGRIVAVELPEDVYRELERRAQRMGYSLVADYVRSLILRDLGYEGAPAAADVERLVEEAVERRLRELVSAGTVEVKPVDVEAALRKALAQLERRIQDMINPWTAKIDNLSSRLADVIERLEELEERVKKLEEQAHQPAAPAAPVSGYGPAHQRVEKGHERSRGRRRSAIERLREQGVVFEHDVQWLRDRDAFFEKLKREGALVLELGGERVAVDPEFWRNFREKLEQLPTANDDEIKILLTDTQYELFRRLKEHGLIYFDTSKKAWRFVEEPTSG
ncbi:MAG: hypothetical protein GXO15_02780 [Crenarchaeota archaeon]|nr:hypothetical protein [Thermoproteota archaeon]